VVSLASAAAALAGPRWVNRWWPSKRLNVDPLEGFSVEGRYAPVSIANFKLIPSVAHDVLAGRIAQPLSFTADGRLTVVISYRDREHHLAQLIPALTAKLREQAVRHRIVVIEQEARGLFNRGRLLNIGMHLTADSTDYYCLHDVDAVPVVANYLCPSQPLRLVNRIVTQQGETRREDYYFSGAVSVRKEQVFAANGYSNDYWGWGKEDDDFFFRLLLAGCLCYFDTHGVFHDLPNPQHQQVVRAPLRTPPHVKRNRRHRSLLLRGLADPAQDGLSTLRYEVIERREYPQFEKIRVRW
jgi:glycosyl transferase family 7 (putative galactosyltransferase)